MRSALLVVIAGIVIAVSAAHEPGSPRFGTVALIFLLGMLCRGIFAGAENATSWGREKGESRFAFACRHFGRTVRRWRKSRYQWLEPEDESDASGR